MLGVSWYVCILFFFYWNTSLRANVCVCVCVCVCVFVRLRVHVCVVQPTNRAKSASCAWNSKMCKI